MKFICFIALFQSIILMAQIEVVKLSKFELLGKISALEEKIYYPSGEQLELDETQVLEFDDQGRLKNDVLKSEKYGSSSSNYLYKETRLIQSEYVEEGILNRQFHNYLDGNHVSSNCFRDVSGELELDYTDTLVYFEDHFNVRSINSAGVEFNIKDVYKDAEGRDTLHIGYLANGEKDYERRFKYIEGTNLFADETIINGTVVASTEYEYRKDGTHVLTTHNPKYEIFIIREQRYNVEGFIEYYSMNEPMRGASSHVEYTYNYDDKGNWVQRRAIDKEGELMEVVERKISYFK